MSDVEKKQGRVVGISVVLFTREPEHMEVQQRHVPMTAQQGMSLLNFIKHRLHGGRLTLEGTPEAKRIITL
jgi:hypothetical protein